MSRLRALGVDISFWQGSPDFEKMKKAGATFVYIKASQNVWADKSFQTNWEGAKAAGLLRGAYHFYRTSAPAKAQAEHFIRHVTLEPGDLPPVLDVEPTNAQIKAYGGTEKLLQAIRTWLHVVEQAVGVRPILYVNQYFVTHHLAEAHDIKRDYQVWIARYGEYKPDVRLAVWQLSPDGRVTGIQGEVDICMKNGLPMHFQRPLQMR